MLENILFPVVPAGQMSNFFLADLVRLAKLAAWSKSDSNSSLFSLNGYYWDHHDTKLESYNKGFEASEWRSRGLNIQIIYF